MKWHFPYSLSRVKKNVVVVLVVVQFKPKILRGTDYVTL